MKEAEAFRRAWGVEFTVSSSIKFGGSRIRLRYDLGPFITRARSSGLGFIPRPRFGEGSSSRIPGWERVDRSRT